MNSMPPIRRLEFPNGKPRLYTLISWTTAGLVAANLLIWYFVPRYWSASVADAAHPVATRINGAVIHVSTLSYRIFAGSAVAAFVAILALVGLGVYYRLRGVATTGVRE